MTSQSWRRAWGSMPVVGSSRKSRSASLTMARATLRRCFWPPESCLLRVVRFSSEVDEADEFVGGERRAARIELVEEVEELGDGELGIERGGLELDADAHLDLACIAGLLEAEDGDASLVGGAQALRPSRWWWSCRRRWGRACRRSRPLSTEKLMPSTAWVLP